MSGLMTPESLSREGSPAPNASQEITLHAADDAPHIVGTHLEVKTSTFTPRTFLNNFFIIFKSTVLTIFFKILGTPLPSVTLQPPPPHIGLAQAPKVILAQAGGPVQGPRLIVPAHGVTLLSSNGTPANVTSMPQGLEIKPDGELIPFA